MSAQDNITTISISTSTFVRAILLVLGVVLLWILRDLILVLLTSVVLASFVESAVPILKKMGLGRVFGVVVLYAVSLLVFGGLFYLFAPLLITEVYNFSNFAASYFPGVSFLGYFQDPVFSGAKDVVTNLSNNFSIPGLVSVSKAFIENLSGGFLKTASVAFGGIFNFILIILISFYLSIQEKGIENFLRIIIPLKYEAYAVDLWERSRRKIGLWVKGQVVLALVVAVLIYLLLSIFGMEYALLLSLIAGVMELVPYGILVALIPAFSFSYISGGISAALIVTGAYFIVHQFEVFLFAPIIIKKVVGLSPIVIILSALIGFELGGVWGAILAIPVSVILMEYLGDLEKDKTLARTSN